MGISREALRKGVDNYAWYKFVDYECDTVFKGRL